MGDKQVCQSSFFPQILQQVDDLCLIGYIQGRYRLITDDEFRIHSQGSGNTDTLLLTAREFSGIPHRHIRCKANSCHQLLQTFLLFGTGIPAAGNDAFPDQVADLHPRIQRT